MKFSSATNGHVAKKVNGPDSLTLPLHDATASAQVRLDYQGGNTKDNRFYLKMGGFFNESVPMGTKFYCKPTGKEPEIDWGALKQL